jgi:outer membrane receptor protein involved in Fe transport
MKLLLRGASGVAMLVALAGLPSAWAQEAPAAKIDQIAPAEPQAESAGVDRVVITGQLIAGASEDAPAPVEVFDLQALKDQGSPTAAEFLRSLSISSEASGEADSQFAGAAAGIATVNLRGLGTGRTLVLLNGNKFNSGAFSDINTLPMMAIGRVDVLKDGASVTYGAGAVGGVINYITRKDFEGFEINASKKLYDGSKGEDNIEALWGLNDGNSNFLLAASYGKRNELADSKRSFASLPYAQQPSEWTTYSTNPSQYVLQNSSSNYSVINDYTLGAGGSCQAIGGARAADLNNSLATSSFGIFANDCAVNFYNTYNLIDEEEYYRGYAEYNGDLNDSTRFHFEASYAKTLDPNIQTGNSLPSGGNVPNIYSGAVSTGGAFSIPLFQPTYSAAGVAAAACTAANYASTPSCNLNPFAIEFFQRAAATGVYTGAPNNLDTSTYYRWRPLMFGPSGAFDSGYRTEKQDRERWGGAVNLKGTFEKDGLFGRFLPRKTGFEYTAYYNQYTDTATRPDFIVSRLQNALNGYGGPGCGALDRVPTNYTSNATYDATIGIQSDTKPGTNGCEYYNPFASSFATSVINGAANPAFNAGNPNSLLPAGQTVTNTSFVNSEALMRWLVADRAYQTTNTALTFNATFTGEVPGFELPGGAIGWAVGSEWRQTTTQGQPLGSQEEIAIAGQPCPWNDDMSLAPTTPGLAACYADRGPYFSSGLPALRPYQSDRQVMSYYGELQFPVLDNLNIQLAGRREEYNEGITGNIWKIAGKYDVLPDLSFRASYSTNFQAPPEGLGASGDVHGNSYIGSLFRNVGTTTKTPGGITPEDDKASNFGVIYTPQLFGGQLRASADFWEITIDKEVTSTSLTPVFQSLFGTPSPGSSTALKSCAAPFISLVTFDTACTQLTPTTTNITAANVLDIVRYNLNSGGYFTNGVDLSLDYTHDIGPGSLFAGLTATNVMHYKVKGYTLPDGTPYVTDFNGLGLANFNPGAGTIMPRWRGNATLGYTIGDHRFNLRANYISGFKDDSGTCHCGQTTVVGVIPASGSTPAQNIYPTYGISPEDLLTFDFNYIFTSPVWKDLELRLSITNLTNEDPMHAQHTNVSGVAQDTRNGYYPAYGDARLRTFEIGVTKKF